MSPRRRPLVFYLGAHRIDWLARLRVPLFVSHRRLRKWQATPRRRPLKAVTRWALDSGGFTELSMRGAWTLEPAAYVEAVRVYRDEIGRLDWAAPMDWMCEPFILAKTGLTVEAHQHRTVDNVVLLRELAPDIPWIPVLQGWEIDDYVNCVGLYADAGVNVIDERLVGVGSVCRRQATDEIGVLFRDLSRAGISCHGFGVKTTGFKWYGHYLASADSMAWSLDALYADPRPGCTHRHCTDCHYYALAWRDRLLGTDELAAQEAREAHEADVQARIAGHANRTVTPDSVEAAPIPDVATLEGWVRWSKRQGRSAGRG